MVRPGFAASMWGSTVRAMLIGPAALIAMQRPHGSAGGFPGSDRLTIIPHRGLADTRIVH
jgi:hypothetical protein